MARHLFATRLNALGLRFLRALIIVTRTNELSASDFETDLAVSGIVPSALKALHQEGT
jgi:hypothetical protein